jgi:uncharacterized protein with PhoU and TrkA domain
VLDDERKVVGTVATSDVVRGYRLGLLASLQQMDPAADQGGSDRVIVASGSPLARRPLRDVHLPLSIIVTTIQRARDLMVPDGDTELVPGDELVLIGTPGDIAAVHALAASDGASSTLQNGAADRAQDQATLVDGATVRERRG